MKYDINCKDDDDLVKNTKTPGERKLHIRRRGELATWNVGWVLALESLG
jgi:hypothetical protein